ncbi:MAG: hypothetical protein C4521_08230 [Actinobacteria bacterium]|nr:MAG: hypothetical protein C4521_08230 [Actinomycetota bacterium]
MKQLTIRDLPPEVERAVREESKKENVSLNRAVIRLLKKAIGVREAKPREKFVYHDLDELAGAWSVAEAEEFDRYLGEQRRIDEELWK